MTQFVPSRFGRLLLNDVLRSAPAALYGTAALMGLTTLVYVVRFRSVNPGSQPAHVLLFGLWLTVAGLLFTSSAFRDLHHPLQRNHYLMLPVSNLERFASRYLLTGPLFVLFATGACVLCDYLALQLTAAWVDAAQPRFSPTASTSLAAIRGYLVAHLFALTGAICFRSHALLKTTLFASLLLLSLVLVENVAERLFFPASFSWNSFEAVRPRDVEFDFWFRATWMNVIFIAGGIAWLMRVAYLCLRDHEVAGGI